MGENEPEARVDPKRASGGGRTGIRVAQLMLVISACGLWVASRMSWVWVVSFDGLGQPRTVTLSGASWSTALLPLALLLLAAAVAPLAVRGWALRLLAVLVAVASAASGYLAVSQWVIRDVSVRAAELAQVPMMSLVDSGRHYTGAAVTAASAVCMLAAAVLLMRSATAGRAGSAKAASTKYIAPAARRSVARSEGIDGSTDVDASERMIWDALDEGRDPTDRTADSPDAPRGESDTEGR